MTFYWVRDLKDHVESHHTKEGVQIRKKKEHRFAQWLEAQGFDQLVRNQRISFKCKETDATWIEVDYYIQRHSDGTIFIVELGIHLFLLNKTDTLVY